MLAMNVCKKCPIQPYPLIAQEKHGKKQGRSNKWIEQRMMGQETRNKLTDYWKEHEIKEGDEFAILTNIIHQEWAELSVKEHKYIKGTQKY